MLYLWQKENQRDHWFNPPFKGWFFKNKMLHLFDFIKFVNFMSTNSINIGFDMESMKCAANKSAKVDFVFDKGTKPYLEDANVFHWCFKFYFQNENFLWKTTAFSLTYYEYFCRKIELVSLFFHPGPQWIWRRERIRIGWEWWMRARMFTEKMTRAQLLIDSLPKMIWQTDEDD